MKKIAYLSTILLLLSSIFNTAKADGLYLLSLEASSSHMASSVWTGRFSAIDGRQIDASEHYKAKNFMFSANGTAAFDLTPASSIILPFVVDAGYQSDLYKAQPLMSLGIGYVAVAKQWQFSLLATDLLAWGGTVTESPCVDSFVREFHCGTGLPWVDYRVNQPTRNSSVKLALKYAF